MQHLQLFYPGAHCVAGVMLREGEELMRYCLCYAVQQRKKDEHNNDFSETIFSSV
jgi:hypothetical protein